jgi:hypothetical protein
MSTTVVKAPIGSEDFNLYNGDGTKTFTRLNSLGGTSTLNKVGYEVDALMSYGGGINYTDTVISSALSTIGTTTKATLVLRPGTWTISKNVDWSAYKNVTFKMPAGAIISHSTYTITLHKIPEAGLYQIFSGTGAIYFKTGKEIYSEWWGAIADGSTDCNSSSNGCFNLAVKAAQNSGIPLKLSASISPYRFTTSITIPSTYGATEAVRTISIVGSGQCFPFRYSGSIVHTYGTCLWFDQTDGTDAIATATRAGYNYNKIIMSNFSLVGPDTEAPRTTTSGHGIKIGDSASVDFVFMENIFVAYFYGSGKAAIYLQGPEDSNFINVEGSYSDYGIIMKGAFNANCLSNVRAQYTQTAGFYIEDSESNTFTGALLQHNEKSGLVTKGCMQTSFISPHFESNNSTSTSGEGAIKFIAANGYTNKNITFLDGTFNGSYDNVNITGGTGAYGFTYIKFDHCLHNTTTFVTLDTYCHGWKFLNTVIPTQIVDGGYGTVVEYFDIVESFDNIRNGGRYAIGQQKSADRWSIDGSLGGGTSILKDGTLALSTTANFSGIVWITEETNGATAQFLVGGNATKLTDQTASYFSHTKDNASTINFYYDSAIYYIQNKFTGTVVVNVFSLRTRVN